jgi:pimeloyl-ACP methyl ester carboxylesterase
MVLLGALGVGGIAWYAADHVIHPPRVATTVTPDMLGLDFRRVEMLARDGISLVGWWMPAEAHAAGTVVFLHAWGASKQQSLAVAPFLHRAGYNVLAFDFRAHGESGGTHTTLGLEEARDVEGAVDWLGGEADAGPVALFGWSMGGAAAINAAPHLPGVRAVVADSSFASLAAVAGRSLQHTANLPPRLGETTILFASWMTGHAPGDDAPVRAARDASQPLLLIQGTADALVPPDNAREIQQAAGARAQLWLVPGAPHVDAMRYHAPEYEARVLDFLSAKLHDPGA